MTGRTVIRAMDTLIAAIVFPAALCLVVLIVVPHLVVFGPPFLFRQARIGPKGVVRHIKIRTMHPAPDSTGRSHLESGRIPRLGRFLRATHLDELPELIMILSGQESFVGPRPLSPDHDTLVWSRERAAARRGWTGYAQLYLRRKGVLPSRIQRRLDRRLASELSPAVYCRVLIATVWTLTTRPRRSDPGPTVHAYRASLTGDRQ